MSATLISYGLLCVGFFDVCLKLGINILVFKLFKVNIEIDCLSLRSHELTISGVRILNPISSFEWETESMIEIERIIVVFDLLSSVYYLLFSNLLLVVVRSINIMNLVVNVEGFQPVCNGDTQLNIRLLLKKRRKVLTDNDLKIRESEQLKGSADAGA